MRDHHIERVEKLCAEVIALCATVTEDRKEVQEHNTATADDPLLWRRPNTKHSAALKRRSMDLTRALADMRWGA